MAELLVGKDVALFIGDSNITNCNWVDVMPQLDTFVRNGGELIFQGANNFDFMFNADNFSTFIDESPWFESLSANTFNYTGIATINENCTNGLSFFEVFGAQTPKRRLLGKGTCYF